MIDNKQSDEKLKVTDLISVVWIQLLKILFLLLLLLRNQKHDVMMLASVMVLASLMA